MFTFTRSPWTVDALPLGHFALTNLLLAQIRSRVVTVSSNAHRSRNAGQCSRMMATASHSCVLRGTWVAHPSSGSPDDRSSCRPLRVFCIHANTGTDSADRVCRRWSVPASRKPARIRMSARRELVSCGRSYRLARSSLVLGPSSESIATAGNEPMKRIEKTVFPTTLMV
jgi:hypothetical protein